MARNLSTKRLTKELQELQNGGTPVGCTMIKCENLQEWIISLEVLGETVYQGEVFALRFRFDPTYPIEVPEVTFVNDGTYAPPVHPHVYSNGHICASILGSGWSPVLNTASVCLTLQSMLASCKKKSRPPDNDSYVKRAPLSPKQTRFDYHDDDV